MKIKALIFSLFLLFSQLACSKELTVAEYKQLKNAELKLIIVEQLGVGISWANSSLSEHKIYCAPPNLAIESRNYLRILDDEIHKGNYKNEDWLGMVMLFGLQKTFPCKQ